MISVDDNAVRLREGNKRGKLPAARIGLWGWVGRYASETLLMVFLLSHLWLVHFASSEPFSADRSFRVLSLPCVT